MILYALYFAFACFGIREKEVPETLSAGFFFSPFKQFKLSFAVSPSLCATLTKSVVLLGNRIYFFSDKNFYGFI